MSGGPGSTAKQRQAEKFARYCELRDQGTLPVDASRETGLGATSGTSYEAAYRKARGMPARRPGWRSDRRYEPGNLRWHSRTETTETEQ